MNILIIILLLICLFQSMLRLDWSVPRTQYAFPRCTATEMRWRRKAVERGSWVTAAIRRPISLMRSRACLPHTPDVSIATGTKSTLGMMSLYFWIFFISAVAAAEPASLLHAVTWLNANVSGHVASQARHRPRRHGSCVTPSGLLPIPVQRPCGSLVAWVPELANARHSRSLIWLCLEWRP